MDILEDMRVQRAVYWAPGEADENAQRTYDIPVEILVRWEDSTEMTLDAMGGQFMPKAMVYVPGEEEQDEGEDEEVEVELHGVLWLSSKTIDDDEDSALLELTDLEDPFNNPDAYTIRRIENIPTIDGTQSLRIAYV